MSMKYWLVVVFIAFAGVGHGQDIKRLPYDAQLNSEACLNEEISYEISLASAAYTQASTYSYVLNGCELVSQDSNVVVFRWPTAGEHSFTVTVVAPNFTYVRERTVQVREAPPQGNVAITQEDFTICQRGETRFSATPEDAEASLKWERRSLDNGSDQYITSWGKAVWGLPGKSVVYCTAINSCGTGHKDSVYVQVNRTPTLTGTSLEGVVPACTDTAYRYLVTGTEPGDTTLWHAFGPGAIVQVVDDTTVDVTWKATHYSGLQVRLRSPEGCSPREYHHKNLDIQGREAIDDGSANYYDWTNYHYAPVCTGDTIQYRTWYNAAKERFYTFRDWYVPEGGTIISQTDTRLIVRWDSAGDYRISGTPFNRCFVGDSLFKEVPVGNGAREPVRHFSNIWLRQGTAGATTASLRWDTRLGSGRHALVALRREDSSHVLPADGEGYAPSLTFGAGADLGSGNYAVQNTLAVSNRTRQMQVDLRGLSPCTPYHASLYPYNRNTDCPEGGFAYNYLTDSAEQIDFWTSPYSFDALAPGRGVQGLRFRESGDSSFVVEMDPGTGSHRMLLAREAGLGGAQAADQTYYEASERFGEGHRFADGAYVVYNGSGSGTTITGLSPDKAYFFRAMEYNQDSTCVIDNAYAEQVYEAELSTHLVLSTGGEAVTATRIYQPVGTFLLQVELSTPASAGGQVELYDVQGRLLLAEQFSPGADRLQMDLGPGLSAQLCVVHVLTEAGREVQRLVIQ